MIPSWCQSLLAFPTQVTYETTGFLEKNRDLLHSDSIQLLSSCSCRLPQAFASSMLIQSEKPIVGPLYKAGGADSQRLSVATKFKVGHFCLKDSLLLFLLLNLLSLLHGFHLINICCFTFLFFCLLKEETSHHLCSIWLVTMPWYFCQGQLFQLMQRLGNTTPHFIRCIKPNNVQSPGLYEQGIVLQQLRCCGVLEVVRISRSGFPTRMSHQKFARR